MNIHEQYKNARKELDDLYEKKEKAISNDIKDAIEVAIKILIGRGWDMFDIYNYSSRLERYDYVDIFKQILDEMEESK